MDLFLKVNAKLQEDKLPLKLWKDKLTPSMIKLSF
jgi:hypothetical protein